MDNNKTPIEETLDRLQQEEGSGKFHNIVNIFKEYFGEDLVDSYTASTENLREYILTIDNIGTFINTHCRIVPTTNNNVTITLGVEGRNVRISRELLNEIQSKTMLELPEELLPLIEIFWNIHTNGNQHQIIIRFPEVTVTNENGKSVNIQELYARVPVKSSGTLAGRFELIRAYYPLDQWNSDYCHSHISHISTDWLEPCTGSGPINGTINRLLQSSDENIWGLFCYELDKFVRVESLEGVPYRRLESIGLIDTLPISNPYINGPLALRSSIISDELLKDFLKTLIEKMPIKVAYTEGSYNLGESFEKFCIRVSKVFAQWYNEKYKEHKVTANLKTLVQKGVLGKYIIKEGRVYSIRTCNRRDMDDYQGQYLFTFKGEEVRLEIDKTLRNSTNNQTYLLSLNFISKLIHKLLVIINYNYGRQKEATTEEETAVKGRTVYF